MQPPSERVSYTSSHQDSTQATVNIADSVTSSQKYGSQRSHPHTPIHIFQRQKSYTPNLFDNQLYTSTSNSGTNQNVFVIAASNNRDTNLQQQDDCQSFIGSGASNTNSADNQDTNQQFEENIIVEQNSKLGILLQTKVLEDKVSKIFFGFDFF